MNLKMNLYLCVFNLEIMTTKEILEGNRLIAEFMGVKPKDVGYSNPMYCIEGRHYFHRELRYSKSWDWLMPVAIKCVNINLNEFLILDKDGFINVLDINFEIASDPIGYLYEKVLSFINWYQSTKS